MQSAQRTFHQMFGWTMGDWYHIPRSLDPFADFHIFPLYPLLNFPLLKTQIWSKRWLFLSEEVWQVFSLQSFSFVSLLLRLGVWRAGVVILDSSDYVFSALVSELLEIMNWRIVRLGAAICGIIVAADNFRNVNVVIAEIILTHVGSFMIYYALVAFYHASYNYLEFTTDKKCKVLRFLARRYSEICSHGTTFYVVRSYRSCHWKWCWKLQLQKLLLPWLGSETCQSIFYYLFILFPDADSP